MSRIDELPPALHDAVNRLLRARVPQAEILRRLNPDVVATGRAPLSRSGLNRHANQITVELAEAAREIRATRAATDALIAQFGERPTSEIGQLNIELIRTMSTKLALAAREEGREPGADLERLIGMVDDLSRTIDRTERAAATATRRERTIREAMAREVESVARNQGLGEDTAAALRAALTSTPA